MPRRTFFLFKVAAALGIAVMLFVAAGAYVGQRSEADAYAAINKRIDGRDMTASITGYKRLGDAEYACGIAMKNGAPAESKEHKLFLVVLEGAMRRVSGAYVEGDGDFAGLYGVACRRA